MPPTGRCGSMRLSVGSRLQDSLTNLSRATVLVGHGRFTCLPLLLEVHHPAAWDTALPGCTCLAPFPTGMLVQRAPQPIPNALY